MIIIKIQGGLGNQISQYALSRWIKIKYPKQTVKLDLTWYKYSPFEFELTKAFKEDKLVINLASKEEVQQVTRNLNYGEHRSLWEKIYNKSINMWLTKMHKNPIVIQTISSGYPETQELYTLDERKDWYFDGFWHSKDYSAILPELQTELVYNRPETSDFNQLEKSIREVEAIGLHIRLGDYEGTEHDILPNSMYYRNAISMITKHITNPFFFIFSDDSQKAIEYWKKMELPYRAQVVECSNRPAYTDMILLSQCQAVICANSTYSYWAALLGYRFNKTILIPEYYAANRKMWKNSLCTTVPLLKL